MILRLKFGYYRKNMYLCSQIIIIQNMDIKGKIKEKGFSMVSVAKEMGITRETLYANISGNTTYKTMRKVADVIGCKVSEFFEDEEDKKGDFASYIRYRGIHYTADTLDEFFKQVDEIKTIAK